MDNPPIVTGTPKIALIHATPMAIDPVLAAFGAAWPEAELANVLDDSLSADRNKTEDLSPELSRRIVDLGHYAERLGTDGILYTCSAFGSAIEAAAREIPLPVLKPNQAMFEAALEHGDRIAMLYTFEPSRQSMEAEFRDTASKRNSAAVLTSFGAAGANDALRAGDADTHNRLVADHAAKLDGFDAVLLAHFSTSRALDTVRQVIDIPVLTAPDSAVAKMRRLIS